MKRSFRLLVMVSCLSAVWGLANAGWNAMGAFNSWSNEAMTETTPSLGYWTLSHSFAANDANGWKVNNAPGGTEYPGGFGADSWYQVTSGTIAFVYDSRTFDDGWQPRTNLLYTDPPRLNSTYFVVGDLQGWSDSSGIALKDDGTEAGDTAGDGIYVVNATAASKGAQSWKCILDSGSWNRQITVKGAVNTGVDNANINFFTMKTNDSVRFSVDARKNRVKTEPDMVGYAAFGGFNSWNYANGITTTTLAGVYTKTVHFDNASTDSWKMIKNNGYDQYPGSGDGQNAWYVVPAGDVDFAIDTNTYTDGWYPEKNLLYTVPAHVASRYTAVGDWQSEAGETGDWKNDSIFHIMKDDGTQVGDTTAGDGIYILNAVVSTPGDYDYKVVLNGSWDRQIRADGPNGSGFDVNDKVTFTTTLASQTVRLFLDINKNRIKAEVLPPPSAVKDWARY